MKRGRKAGISVSHCSKCGQAGTDNRTCGIGHRKRGRRGMGPHPQRGFGQSQRAVERRATLTAMCAAGDTIPEMARATGLRLGTVLRILERRRRAEVARG